MYRQSQVQGETVYKSHWIAFCYFGQMINFLNDYVNASVPSTYATYARFITKYIIEVEPSSLESHLRFSCFFITSFPQLSLQCANGRLCLYIFCRYLLIERRTIVARGKLGKSPGILRLSSLPCRLPNILVSAPLKLCSVEVAFLRPTCTYIVFCQFYFDFPCVYSHEKGTKILT